jgi:8-oxo-dGTP diphosphatase
MNSVRLTAGALLIDTSGRFLFQQRDDIPDILHPGKIGLFGGHREGAETALQCVCREVHEETGSLMPESAFHHWF